MALGPTAIFNEPQYSGDWLKGEDESGARLSRREVVILAGSGSARVLTSGMVIGKNATTGKYEQINFAGIDGTEIAAGIQLYDASAPDGTDAEGVIIDFFAAVADSKLVWPGGASQPEIDGAIAELEALNIKVREAA